MGRGRVSPQRPWVSYRNTRPARKQGKGKKKEKAKRFDQVEAEPASGKSDAWGIYQKFR